MAKTPTSWTERELNRRQREIAKRYPAGLTVAQFRQLSLESARTDDRIHTPWVDFFARHSIMTGMWLDGLVEHRGGPRDPLIWYITDKGRAASRPERERQT